MAHPSRREHLIDTALALFLRDGFHATGIDAILGEAGVSKKTMYRHFRSKDELILAALKKKEGIARNDFMRRVDAAAPDPKERLLAIFDYARAWFGSKDFYGCLFINAISEYAEPGTPLRRVSQDYKAAIETYIRDLAKTAGLKDPGTLARQLFLLFEGATVAAQVSGNPEAAKEAKAAAEILIENAGG